MLTAGTLALHWVEWSAGLRAASWAATTVVWMVYRRAATTVQSWAELTGGLSVVAMGAMKAESSAATRVYRRAGHSAAWTADLSAQWLAAMSAALKAESSGQRKVGLSAFPTAARLAAKWANAKAA